MQDIEVEYKLAKVENDHSNNGTIFIETPWMLCLMNSISVDKGILFLFFLNVGTYILTHLRVPSSSWSKMDHNTPELHDPP